MELSEEQINFLREQFTYSPLTREKVIKLFNEKFGENKGKSFINRALAEHKILKDKKYYKKQLPKIYDGEKIYFLRQHYEKTPHTKETLTKLFNKKFKLNKSVIAIGDVLKKNNIKKDKRYHTDRRKTYTDEHINYIRKIYTENPDMGKKELIKLFNEKFNLGVSICSLNNIMHRFKLGKGKIPSVFTQKVKQFIIKCVEEGLSKNQCKDACEKEFERHFNRESMGQIAHKMGLSFRTYPKEEINKLFKECPESEDLVRQVVNENPESNHHVLLIRDALIEKYQQNLTALDIRNFCGVKRIKINDFVKSLEEKKEMQRNRDWIRRNNFTERGNPFTEREGLMSEEYEA